MAIRTRNKLIISYAVFLAVSFIFNFIWENAHSGLYRFLPPMEKTFGHLAWFSAKDAGLTLGFVLLVALAARSWVWFLKPKIWQIIFLAAIGFIVASYIEIDAISSGRWAYLSAMPIIPLLNAGLTPILQMSLGPPIAIILTSLILKKYGRA